MPLPSVYRYDPDRTDDLSQRPGFTAIYGLFDPRTHELRYIGKTVDPAMRLKAHWQHALRPDARPLHMWTRELRGQGVRPVLQVIEWAVNVEWKRAERYHLWQAKALGIPLLNARPGGAGFEPGRKRSPEFCRKMSERSKRQWENPDFRTRIMGGWQAWWANRTDEERRAHIAKLQAAGRSPEAREKRRMAATGRQHSDETKANISAANRGARPSSETRARMSAAQKAKRPASAESRAKMSASQKGRTASPETRARMSESRRQLWEDPAYRQQSIASVTGVPKRK